MISAGGDVVENAIFTNKTCTTCHKECPIDQFKGQKQQETKQCFACRERCKQSDKNRDKEHRNKVARKNEAKPERKAVKKKWEEDNYDKVAKKCMDYRQRQIETLGTEEYLKKQAAQAKKWRENNPEKMEEANEKKKNSREQNYNVYKRSAEIKNLEFKIEYDEYINLVENECYYCGILQEKGFNGIDRRDQTMGYILDNCVSCCQLCNYMKGSLSDVVFINRIEHILTFQKKIDGRLNPECFADHKSASYNGYKDRANKKDFVFEITEEDYDNITNGNCFMCGKNNNECHRNGLDRMDSNKGYVVDNLNSCCGECNYMKKTYGFIELIEKFCLIYNKHKTDVFENTNNNNTNNHIIVKTNKKSKEEIKENEAARKKIKQTELKARYNDEEYKINRAKEIAAMRKEKVL